MVARDLRFDAVSLGHMPPELVECDGIAVDDDPASLFCHYRSVAARYLQQTSAMSLMSENRSM